MIHLLKRELRLSIRSGGGFGLSLAFFLVASVLVPLGVGPDSEILRLIAPGILWVAALLACLLSLDRLFQIDYEDGSLELLATSPIPLESVVIMKATAHWMTTGLPLTLAAPILGILLNIAPAGYAWLLVSLAIGTPALSMIGAFGAALTVRVRRGGPLLPLLVLPLYVPTLVYGAECARRGAEGYALSAPMAFLAGITLATLALLPFAAATVLRISLR